MRTWTRFGQCRTWTLLVWLLGVAVVRAENAEPVAVVDDRGRAIRLEHPPLRIVSLVPSLTESVCVLDACARLVGTDRYSNWPESVKLLPKLGGLDDASLEGIAALHPDIVLASRSARTIGRLDELGIEVVSLEANSLGGARHALVLIAQVLGRPEAGVLAWQHIETQFDAAAARVPVSLRGRHVYFEVGSAPYAASAGSFIGEVIARLALANAVPASLGPFPKLNPEFVVRAQPDIIMIAAAEAAALRERPGWDTLAALRTGQVCTFPSESFDILVRPGPRLGEAAGVMATCLESLPAMPR